MTHEVFNQTPPLTNYNLFTSDLSLQEALTREGGAWGKDRALQFGKTVGSEEAIQWGFQANQNLPILRTHDTLGNRRDEVEYHPTWHAWMGLSVKNGLHSLPWTENKPGAHAVRTALYYMGCQIEQGHYCPITMTFAIIPTLRLQPDLAKKWEPKIFSSQYDARLIPADQKQGLICGMALTEKQGGSDVRANTSQAKPLNQPGPGQEYLLTGHKWFCSAPMSDAFLVLAQSSGGISCFWMPRYRPDGSKNNIFIQRLKDKLGNRSNASGEIEFKEAWAVLIGNEGRGVANIIKMVSHTRFDCIIGSSAIMRQATIQAIYHTEHRMAFGKKLIDQPLMRNVLSDLAIDSEAGLLLAMRLARAYDEKEKNETASAFSRIGTAVGKYWICKRTPSHVFEAMECLGGNGYVEESILPRLYREAPVNSIWEGSGNVNSLDLLRAIAREPNTLEVLLEELKQAQSGNRDFDQFIKKLEIDLQNTNHLETRARDLIERLALSLQASLMLRYSSTELAETFCRSRLAKDHGYAFGTLPADTPFDAIIQHSRAQV